MSETIITGVPRARIVGPRRLEFLEKQSAGLRPAGFAAVDHGVFRDCHWRRAVPRRQRDQPHPAKQLHRHHGAGHAAGYRRRQHRPVRRLDRWLRRRLRGDAHGGLSCSLARLRPQATLAAGHPTGAYSRRRDRRFSGLLHRLQQDPLVHRDARRHADFSRTDRQHAAGPVCRAFRQRASSRSAPALFRTSATLEF